MRKPQCWNGLHTKKFCCLDPAVTGNDLTAVVNKHGGVETKALNAVGDLPDLLSRMGPGIALIGRELIHRNELDHAVGAGENAVVFAAGNARNERARLSLKAFGLRMCS